MTTLPTLPDQATTLEPSTVPARTDFSQQRLLSLDTYRGIIMVTLAFTAFGLAGTARNHFKIHGSSPFWEIVYFHTEHAEWTGGGFWDMIQPSFMFMVGAAMAFSYSKRLRMGQTYRQMLGHAVARSFILIFLGILLAYWRDLGNWGLMNVLTQIGLGYTFLFLLWNRPFWAQGIAAVGVLIATWSLYVGFAGAGIDLAKGDRDRGIAQDWATRHLTGIDPAWHKNANVGHDIDMVLLNSAPRTKTFVFNNGGYQTINFLPSLATMIFGLMAGELLRRGLSGWRKALILMAGGIGGIALGQVLHATGTIPLVKRIWTPSWALYSSGWCCLFLAGLYVCIDLLGYRSWTFPLVVVGMNSIAIYTMTMLLREPVIWPLRATILPNLGDPAWIHGPTVLRAAALWPQTSPPIESFVAWHETYRPLLHYTFAGLVFWLACYVLYRRGIFVRI